MLDRKVLIITERFPPDIGGVSNSVFRISLNLKKKINKIHIFNLSNKLKPGEFKSYYFEEIVVHKFGNFKNLTDTLRIAENKIREIQKKFSFDIFHGYYLYSSYLAVFLGKFFNIKSVISLRGNDIDNGIFSKDFQFLFWTLNNADAICCVSKEILRKCEIITNNKNIYFVPNSVDVNLFKPMGKNKELVEKFKINEEKIIGFVGELRFKKGTVYLLEAFKEVSKKIKCRLFIIGALREEDKKLLENFLSENKNLKEKVQIIDYISNPEKLSEYYNLLDIVVFPSLWEGMPNSLLEAMACGRLVIGSNVGGIKDVIIHGENGFLIDPSELERLGEGILEIFDLDEEKLEMIRKKSREHILKNFTLDVEIEKVLNIYKKLYEY
jgi:glycosyltransferase involved in cell wall biosynthesis